MARIRGILFDLGDTLLDFGPVDTLRMFEAGARLAYAYLWKIDQPLPPFRVFHRRQLRAVKWRYVWSRIIRREFNSLDVLDKLSLAMGQRLTPAQTEELAWMWYEPLSLVAKVEEGLPAMLAEWRRQGLTLGLVSNTFVPPSVLDRHLAAAGLLEHLPIRVYSCQTRYRKPHPRIFQIALERTGLSPGQTLFVGDSLVADIRGANQAEMMTVLKDPTGQRRLGRVKPDFRIRALRELPGIVVRLTS